LRRNAYDKLLPMLTIFSAWLEKHPIYLVAAEEIEGGSNDVALPAVFSDSLSFDNGLNDDSFWKRKYCICKEHGRNELRARSSLRSAFSTLRHRFLDDLSYLNRHPTAHTHHSDALQTFQALREFGEMRGYLPMAGSLEVI
jgi:hypothetical protein